MTIIVMILVSISILLYSLGTNKNIIKTVLLLNMIQTNIILIFLYVSDSKGVVPITKEHIQMADPLPQALMITAIVIGAAITSLAIMLSIKVFHNFGTLDWDKISGEEDKWNY